MIIDIKNLLHAPTLFKINFTLNFLVIILIAVQLFIADIGFELISILFLIFLSTLFLSKVLSNSQNYNYFILPILVIFSTYSFYFFFPLISKTLLLQPINSHLYLSQLSFLLCFIYFLSILVAFFLYKKNFLNNSHKKSIFDKFNVFTVINYNSIFFLFLFLLSIKFYLAIFDQGITYNTNYGDKLMKFIYGFEKFFYLPLIFYFIYLTKNKIINKKIYLISFIYLILSIFFAIITNSRTEIFALVSIFLIMFLILFLNKQLIFNKFKFFISILIIMLFLIIVESVSKKILDFRNIRNEVTSLELLHSFNKSNGVDNKILSNKSIDPEYYTGNKLIDRFSPIIFLDKMLYEANYLSQNDKLDFLNYVINKQLAIFPENLIKIFKNDYSKEFYMIANGSYVERKANNILGGDFNKGSIVIELFILSGYIFPLYFILLYYFLFLILNKFQKISGDKIIFSPLILTIFFDVIYITQADGLFNFLLFLIRYPLELIFLYNIMTIFFKKNIIA
jgi:hypothetical protein